MTRTHKTKTPRKTPQVPPVMADDIAPEQLDQLPDDMKLDVRKFGRHMRVVELLGRRTGIKVHVSDTANALQDGDIYLFNHFTRFETVVVPTVIFKETGKLSRSVAYAGLFDVNDTMSRILHQAGGVPNNFHRLLPFLAEEILRGRKVIIFPEGGLVKDKNVVDANGNLKMWSGVAEKVRKPHRGAAVLALMLDLAKRKIKTQFAADDQMALTGWCTKLDLSLEELRAAVEKPTLIVPSNITFYPMRTNPNILVKSLERIMGETGPRARDELTIEGNLLLRPTDMDVRFGTPISALGEVKKLQAMALDHALSSTHTMDEVFALKDQHSSGAAKLLDSYVAQFVTRRVDRIREDYSRRIYLGTTININHLTSMLVRILTEQGRWEFPKQDFHNVLYLALKALQQHEDVHLHMTLARPELYADLLHGKSRGFIGFLEACHRARLMKAYKDVYTFSRRLHDVQDLQDIRLENPLQVHANEAEPIEAVREVLTKVLAGVEKISDRTIAELRFDDMVRAHAGQRYRYGKKAPATVLGPDCAHTGRPYLLLPELAGKKANKTGVVLVHGFAKSPAELRAYADHLREMGHVVLGVRLPGHGTSYLDLETRSRAEWLSAVRDAYEIVAAMSDEVVIIGFSTGGALSLLLAKEHLPKLVRVASVAAPLLVSDSNMHLLPLVMAAREVIKGVPGLHNALRFYGYDEANSVTVYPKVPVTALNELRLLIKDMRHTLPKVTVPVLVLQGLMDHTVKAQSAALIYKLLGSSLKALRWIAGGPHSLITNNFGATWDILDDFVAGADVTGKHGADDYKIQAEPAKGKKSAKLGQIIRKFA